MNDTIASDGDLGLLRAWVRMSIIESERFLKEHSELFTNDAYERELRRCVREGDDTFGEYPKMWVALLEASRCYGVTDGYYKVATIIAIDRQVQGEPDAHHRSLWRKLSPCFQGLLY